MKRKDFNNFQDYLNYLIYDKNIINTKTGIIGAGLIAVIAFSSLGLFNFKGDSYLGHEEGYITREYMIDILVQTGFTHEELTNLSDDRLSALYNNVYLSKRNQQAGKPKFEEYPKNLSAILKQDYYVMASKGDFKSIISDFENKKLEYAFSDIHNTDIITIYNDAYYLNTIINEKDDDIDINMASQVLPNIKDPQMLLYGTLFSPEEARRNLFKDKVSISPILATKNIRVNSVSSGALTSANTKFKDDYRFSEVARYINEGDFIIYKIDFTIDGTNLFAYIYKNASNLDIDFYGIYYPPGTIHKEYLSVMEWIALENDILNGNINRPTLNPEDFPELYEEDNSNSEIFEENNTEETVLEENNSSNQNNDSEMTQEDVSNNSSNTLKPEYTFPDNDI